jgi:hypothetical protein
MSSEARGGRAKQSRFVISSQVLAGSPNEGLIQAKAAFAVKVGFGIAAEPPQSAISNKRF